MGDKKIEEGRKRAKDFERVVRPVIEWINENCHLHTKAIVDCTSGELVEGVIRFITEEYIKD